MIDYTFTILAKPNTGDYYEGNRTFLRAIYPRPIVSPVQMMNSWPKKIVFREDSYDPVTRLRRGRLYQQADSVEIPSGLVPFTPYPQPYVIRGASGGLVIQFQTTFEQSSELNTLLWKSIDCDILLGAKPAQTRWRIIDAEGLSDGTTLFTLKSSSSFGVLPRLNESLQNKDGQPIEVYPVQAAIDKLVDAFHVQHPVPIVDVCRESTRLVLARWIGAQDADAEDLGGVIKVIPKENFAVEKAASIINRFHPRTKSSEQEKQNKNGTPLRTIIGEDAELSVQLFGFILREIGWAVR